MGEQSASRLAGDDYQHLYSWYELLQLLNPESGLDEAYVEHPHAGAADDVTLHPRPGSGRSAKFVQVKFHVTFGATYSFESLAEVATGAARSLLKKLFDTWKTLSSDGRVEIWLVSNWPLAPHPDLGAFVNGQTCSLAEEFFEQDARRPVRSHREGWKNKLGATDEELHGFCRALRLRVGFGSTSDLEERVDDRMVRHGLRSGVNARRTAIGLVREWIKKGGTAKRVTADSLRQAISEADLRTSDVQQPALSLWIHGWAKRAFDVQPNVELDLTPLFEVNARRIPDNTIWEERILPSLVAAKKQLLESSQDLSLDFRGKVPLTLSLAVGAVFAEGAGFSFRCEQPTRGEIHLWRSNASPSQRSLAVREEVGVVDAKDAVVVLNITGRADADVGRWLATTSIKRRKTLFLEPDIGPGDGSLASASDAVALAVAAKDVIRQLKTSTGVERVHLIPFAPASFCLFLGQRLNALGDIVTYERANHGGYQQSVILHTR